MNHKDVEVKRTEPLRVAEARGAVSALDPQHIGRVFLDLSPRLIEHLERAGARPGLLVHYYDEPARDGSIGVHVGYEIGEQPVPEGDGIDVVDLPVIRVASAIHHGGVEGIVFSHRALIRWIEDAGYRVTGYGRELYHEMTAQGPSVTEIQLPIAAA